MNCFLDKVEDHISDFDATPFVNYQGDCYMGKDGVMYLVVEDFIMVDVLGNVVPKELHHGDKGPPMTAQMMPS